MKRSQALGGLVVVLALAGAGAGLSLATPARALEPSAAADDTTTTPTTPEPSPDPAPAPAPSKPQPVSKPAPAPVHHSPTPVYHAPVYHAPEHTTPTHTYSRPTYTPPPTHTTQTAPQRKQKKPLRHVATKSKPVPQPQPKPTPVAHINVGSPTAAVTTPASGDSLRRALVIAGMGFAAVLFLIVVAVPATGARFTAPGRVVIDHQTDLVLVGVATLLLTALLFAVTGGG
jgi:hypothetical protein